jgi:hypothetical protein
MLDRQSQTASKEEIEKLIETELVKEIRRLHSFGEDLGLSSLKESTTVGEALQMVKAGRAFTDEWCAFVKRVRAGDSLARVQVYVVAQYATELVMELSATDPDLAKLALDLARLKGSHPTLQRVQQPDYGPKVRRDLVARIVKYLVWYVGVVGDEHRRHAEGPDIGLAPPKYHRWATRAAKLRPLSESNIEEWDWCIWRAFRDSGFVEVMTSNGDRPSDIHKMVTRKLQALAAASQKKNSKIFPRAVG